MTKEDIETSLKQDKEVSKWIDFQNLRNLYLGDSNQKDQNEEKN